MQKPLIGLVALYLKSFPDPDLEFLRLYKGALNFFQIEKLNKQVLVQTS